MIEIRSNANDRDKQALPGRPYLGWRRCAIVLAANEEWNLWAR